MIFQINTTKLIMNIITNAKMIHPYVVSIELKDKNDSTKKTINVINGRKCENNERFACVLTKASFDTK